MAEYIERKSVDNVLIDLLGDVENDEECSCEFARGFEQALSCVEEKVKDIPTADVRPERYGSWLYVTEDGENAFYECSECGAFSNNCTSPFCWKCGAKMDGKDGE